MALKTFVKIIIFTSLLDFKCEQLNLTSTTNCKNVGCIRDAIH
jgi:hypothetical protein